MANKEKIAEFRRRRKLNLMHLCGDKCNICGYCRTVGALEFHHIIPSEKKYGISSGNCHSLEEDIEEIKKCILVCANCHREIHDGLYSTETLQTLQIFSPEQAELLIQERNDTIYGKELKCSQCGVDITRYSSSGLCPACVAKNSRAVKRPSREELKNLIRTESFVAIGNLFGVTDNAIRKWCKAENLPFRKADIQKIQNWEEV